MELDPFENAARTDALRLRHWKKNNDKNTTYTFARFNKTVRILSYSDSEYATVLQHATWTKEETDALFEKCRQFDLRWPVTRELPASPPPLSPQLPHHTIKGAYVMDSDQPSTRSTTGLAISAILCWPCTDGWLHPPTFASTCVRGRVTVVE